MFLVCGKVTNKSKSQVPIQKNKMLPFMPLCQHGMNVMYWTHRHEIDINFFQFALGRKHWNNIPMFP